MIEEKDALQELMSGDHIVIELRISWWWKHYVAGVVFMAKVTGQVPDWHRVEKMLRRALWVRVRAAGRASIGAD